MIFLSIILVLLFFEPSIIQGRPYNCYTSLPCPLTNPAVDPAWSYDVTANTMPPINLFISTATGCGSSNSCSESQQQEKPCPPPAPPCPKKKKKERDDFFTTKFFTNLFAIPGALADTFLNGEIII